METMVENMSKPVVESIDADPNALVDLIKNWNDSEVGRDASDRFDQIVHFIDAHTAACVERATAELRAELAAQPSGAASDLDAVHAFLMGEAALDGVWFGEADGLPHSRFWWRNNLRAALATLRAPVAGEMPPGFAEWLAREMPPNTIIGDPAWWAPRIARQLAACRAAASVQAEPQGWKLVPIEPTEAMQKAGGHSNSEWLNDFAPIGESQYVMPMPSVWAAMLAAAPLPVADGGA